MDYRVTAFTDSYLPTVNGVTYTIQTWRDYWTARGGHMDVVYPQSDGYSPGPGEFPVDSVAFPFYEGFRLGMPELPTAARSADLVHVHTPFSLGLSGLRLARSRDLPVVASYHTPAGEYANYLGPTEWITDKIRGTAETYERTFYDRADVVLVPSKATLRHLTSQIGVSGRIEVIGNGVDTRRFRPVETAEFRARHDLPDDRPIVGYTGRQGYEKCLDDLVAAADGLDATVVFGGDGPAREDLEAQARTVDADVRFLGFLDREELPAFYSAMDVFAFPSPVETEGVGALEAIACGTPVVAVNSGALAYTVDDGVTGYHYPEGDVPAFVERITAALANREELVENCLDYRERISVERSIEHLAGIYDEVR